ncbi:hypothetical protein F991_02563 [Acinetobacter sp. CIP-A165]|uniref:hypothetical protein n=1 Tax=Acinetobacter sp. CIP-A165 TaxID=40373 RepID=UPI0002D071AE|nr:hypothetical protein [Acinetobacter sp. CIP-A165]ENU29516.1 hypothetical protein F991_02563 [Acinetobacter sp. CIP-A165]
METLLKIGGVLAVLVVPILLSILNNRLAHLKHTKESKAEALKLADEFEAEGLENRSTLYKDRLAKSLFNNDALTYSEAKFFVDYEDADFWVKEFVKSRGMLKLERDDDGTVIGLKRKSHWIYFIFNFIGYCACVSIGLIPFVIMNKYFQIMVDFYGKGMPLVIVLMIAIPALFLVVGYLCLRYTEKYASCGIFLHDFYTVAFKIKSSEEKNDSEVDAAA